MSVSDWFRSEYILDSAETGYCFLDGLEFFDEGQHAVLGVVEFLGLFEDVGGFGFGDDDDSVLVGADEIAGVDFGSGAGDRDIHAGDAEVVDGG